MSAGLGIYDVCLDASTSNIAISDGTNTLGIDANGAACIKVQDSAGDVLAVNADGSINVVTSAMAKQETLQNTAETVTTTAAEIVATPLSGRCSLIIQNNGTDTVYLGQDNTVTAANGLCIPKKSSLQYDLGENADLWMIAASGSQDVRVMEFA